jgi:hypothetical protein
LVLGTRQASPAWIGRVWQSRTKTWEEMKAHMYVIADAMTDALVKQFAKKF